MAVRFDPDVLRSASDRHMAQHLTAPFAAGAVETPVAIVAEARADITWSARDPIVLVGLLAHLGTERLLVSAVLDPDHAATSLPGPLLFASFSESGASLSLHRPPVDPTTRMAAPFTIKLSVERVPAVGPHTLILDRDLSKWIEVRVLEGIFGRTMHMLASEKQRLRRQARELDAMRLLVLARDGALDAMGADVGVQRFGDAIGYDQAKKEIITVTRREPDDEYRRRLALYRPTLMPNKRRIVDLLNGPGLSTDPNAGALHAMSPGFTSRFTVTDAYNPLAFAVLLVSSQTDQVRLNFLEYLRAVHLIWPLSNAKANAVHSARFLPARLKTYQQELRMALRTLFAFQQDAAADPALAPVLADALVRAGQCRQALGLAMPWPITRVQKSDGGSRYELGLGLNLSLSSADLTQLGNARNAANRVPAADPQVEALLASMTVRSPADDPEGHWFLEPCGLRTVYRVDPNTVYLSHFPTFGMLITGPSMAGVGVPAGYDVRLRASEDKASNVVLDHGLSDAATAWAARAGEAWTLLNVVDAQNLWDKAVKNNTAGAVFTQAGLVAVTDPKPVVEQLKKLPQELVDTVRLGPALTQRILQGDAANELQALTTILADSNISAVLPFVTSSNEVVLVIAVTGLPVVGVNLLDQRSTMFRWYAVPVGIGGEGTITPVGSHATFTPYGSVVGGGLTALVVVGYARRGLADPYAFRVDLPSGALLNLPQYEFLMNLLEHAIPAGVEVNTFSIRKGHVDLNGDAIADPLPPTISKTYRLFQRRRLRGETAVPVGTS